MPWIAFMANGLWVLVIGLMGPSVPFIIKEYSLDYSQAGFLFTLLSIGAIIGTFVGGWVSDYPRRKVFWLVFLCLLTGNLVLFGLSPAFSILLIIVFIMSLFGSPIGAVGQSVMLQMYPEKRGAYLSLSTMFAAVGSLIAPFLVSLLSIAGFSWRSAFFITAALALLLFILVAASRLPQPSPQHCSSLEVFRLFTDCRILFVGLMIFFSIGIDLGFSYWLAEYFVSRLGAAVEISGFAVGSFLIGVIIGRLLNSRRSEAVNPWLVPRIGLAVAFGALVLFLNIEGFLIKMLLCFIYGLGVGPIFPSMMSAGTALYPERSGAVTAVLFSLMSLGGAVFPMIIGLVGSGSGIESAYYSIFIIMIPIAAGLFVGVRLLKRFA